MKALNVLNVRRRNKHCVFRAVILKASVSGKAATVVEGGSNSCLTTLIVYKELKKIWQRGEYTRPAHSPTLLFCSFKEPSEHESRTGSLSKGLQS